MIKQPPEHAADAEPLFIAEFDEALDQERIAKERKALKNGDTHCVTSYYDGDTRYDLDAPHTVGGSTVTMRGYIVDGSTPTVFKLRRVTGLQRQQAIAVATDSQAFVGACYQLCKNGVVGVTDGFGGDAWDLEGGEGGLPLTDRDVQKLFDANASLPQSLGMAVLNASKSLSDAEKKP